MTQEYVGTKIVTAWPSLLVSGNSEDGTLMNSDGYAVKYADGYTSWSPKNTFEATYLPLGHISSLPEWEQRVIAERRELDDKITKLQAFLNDKDKAHLHSRFMQAQLDAMRTYITLLDCRIAEFMWYGDPERYTNKRA